MWRRGTEYVGGGEGVGRYLSDCDSSRRACRLAIAVIRCAMERGQPTKLAKADGRIDHLILRTLGIENGEEELTVSVLAFGELESSKDLSERWRCGLKIERNRQIEGAAEREGGGPTCSRILREESMRCWGWWTVEFMAGQRGRARGRRGGC